MKVAAFVYLAIASVYMGVWQDSISCGAAVWFLGNAYGYYWHDRSGKER